MNAEQNSRFDAWERATKLCDENPNEVALNAIFQADKDLKCYGGGERNNIWAAFSQSGKSYKKVMMKITFKI